MGQPKLPVSFNVVALLKGTSVGASIVSDYLLRNEAYITNNERVEIVRIAVHHLSTLSSGLYPSSETKLMMAKAIVAAFPGFENWIFSNITAMGYLLQPENTRIYRHKTEGFAQQAIAQ